MKLISLKVAFFRQHIDTLIEFPEGLTGIIGLNGAGKSTIVEAIAFALYGSKAIRGKIDQIKTRNVSKESEPEVSLLFEHEGSVFRIERSLDSASLYLGGEPKPISVGSREVSARVSQVLSMDYPEFLATFYTEQKGLEFLSGHVGASERERFIVRMLGYDKLENVQELLRSDKRDLKNELIGREAGLGSQTELEARLKLEENELALIQTKADEAAKVLIKQNEECDTWKKRLQNIDGLRRSWLMKREALSQAQIRYEEKSKRIKVLDRELRELKDTLQTLSTDELSEDALERALKSLSDLEQKLAGANQLREKLQIEHGDSVGRLRGQIESFVKKLEERRKAHKNHSKLDPNSPCPTCGQELGKSFGAVTKEYEKEIKQTQAEIEKLKEAEAKLRVEPSEITSLRVDLAQLEAQQKECTHKIERLRRHQASIGSLHRVERELTQAREELSDLDRILVEHRAELAELKFSEEEYLKLQAGAEASARLLEVSRLSKVKLEGEHETKKALFQRTKRDLELFEVKASELRELKRRLLLLEESDQVLTQFRKYLNSSLRPRLAELSSEFITELTDGRYTTVELSADFTPTVVEDGEPKAVISGGEEDILNLSLRLSLSNLIAERAGQQISLLILDEVFGSLDENRRNNVLSLLDRLKSRFEQILVITHLDDIKEGVENLIYVDYDETSGLVKVGQQLEIEELASNI